MLLIITICCSCGSGAAQRRKSGSSVESSTSRGNVSTKSAETEGGTKGTRYYGYRVVAELPHSTDSYTQGLEWHDGLFYEGTGLNGSSRLMVVNPASGQAQQSVSLARKYFGEGITVLNNRIYQLTWTGKKAFVYDRESLRKVGEFSYEGEGWGLANDGTNIYMSDGTSRIEVRSPKDFSVLRSFEVKLAGRPQRYLNELEWIDGELWANVYMSDVIVRINPSTGAVVGVIDLADLQSPADRDFSTDVLNGIAWDKTTRRLFVTGKNWNKVYQIELTEDGD